MMLPIFSLWRSGNITEDAVDEYFGDIRIALVVKQYARFGGIVLAGLFVLLALGMIIKLKKLKGKKEDFKETFEEEPMM